MQYAFLGVDEYAYFIFVGYGYVGNIWLLSVGEYAALGCDLRAIYFTRKLTSITEK